MPPKRNAKNGWDNHFWKLTKIWGSQKHWNTYNNWERINHQINLPFSKSLNLKKKVNLLRMKKNKLSKQWDAQPMSCTWTRILKKFTLSTQVTLDALWVKQARLLKWVLITSQSVRLKSTELKLQEVSSPKVELMAIWTWPVPLEILSTNKETTWQQNNKQSLLTLTFTPLIIQMTLTLS